jgi:ubiquinone biosynthesis protein COQ9
MNSDNQNIRDAIIDTAIALAEQTSWEAVRLFDVAAKLKITLEDMRLHFREKEELVDAWFDRADSHMLKESQVEGFLLLSSQQRIHHLVMAWLDALSVHRKVTREMIGAKLEFGHIHIQIPGVMRISRTVQWVREAAQRDATFMRRALEETALTTIYLMTFIFWMRDESENSRYTRQFLERKLYFAKILDHVFFGRKRQVTEQQPRQLENLSIKSDH